MEFRSNVSGLGPDALVTWDFGDESGATGDGVAHVFGEQGIYVVTVVASDSSGASATASTTVTARSLTGSWHRPGQTAAGDIGFTIRLSQAGRRLEGAVELRTLCLEPRAPGLPPGVITGSVSSRYSVEWTLDCAGHIRHFAGEVHPDLDAITGSYGSGELTYFRQGDS